MLSTIAPPMPWLCDSAYFKHMPAMPAVRPVAYLPALTRWIHCAVLSRYLRSTWVKRHQLGHSEIIDAYFTALVQLHARKNTTSMSVIALVWETN